MTKFVSTRSAHGNLFLSVRRRHSRMLLQLNIMGAEHVVHEVRPPGSVLHVFISLLGYSCQYDTQLGEVGIDAGKPESLLQLSKTAQGPQAREHLACIWARAILDQRTRRELLLLVHSVPLTSV